MHEHARFHIHAWRSLPPCLTFLLLVACDPAPRDSATSPEEIVVVAAAADPGLSPVFDEQLAAPVVYVGRPETPYRVRRVSGAAVPALASVSTAVVVSADPHEEAASWSGVAPISSGTLRVAGSEEENRWWVYENVLRNPQTLVRLRRASAQDEATTRRLAVRIRRDIESSLVHHEVARLQRGTGAAALPRRATGGAFGILLPAGYAWSDTSSGWPGSVQLSIPHPTRVVCVFWLEEAAEEWLHSRGFLLGFVRDAVWRLHQDRLAEESVDWRDDPEGRPTLRCVWQNPEAIAGGPMQVRFDYDASRRRLYGVQALVFLPGADKHAAMREVLAVASTFEILE